MTRPVFLTLSILLFLFFPIRILQAFAISLLLIMAVSWIWSVSLRRFVRISFAPRDFKSFLMEKSHYEVIVENASLFPVWGLVARDGTGGLNCDSSDAASLDVPPMSTRAFSISVFSARRGLYQLGPLKVSGADPLALFPFTIETRLPRSVFVYPSITDLHLRIRDGFSGGRLRSQDPMYTDTSQIKSLRPYEAGDDVRFIHWKASARSGETQVMTFVRQFTVPLLIVAVASSRNYHPKRRSGHFERIVELAAALVREAAEVGCPTALASDGVIPAEAQRVLDMSLETHEPIQTAFADGLGHAGFLLTLLSVLELDHSEAGERENLLSRADFKLSPRVIVLTPPLAPDVFETLTSSIPGRSRIDFWFLEEYQDARQLVDHRSVPPSSRVHFTKIPEFGDPSMVDLEVGSR